MPYRYLAVERHNRVALVTMTNPPYNFLRQGMVHELEAVRGIKRCVWEGGAMDIASGLRVETEEFLATMETEWARERLRQAADAYRAGSPPAW